jgi:hypothetical protein
MSGSEVEKVVIARQANFGGAGLLRMPSVAQLVKEIVSFAK